MKWNNHSKLVGSHAFLGASKFNWINDDPEKLKRRYMKYLAVQRGTDLHDLAARMIKLGVNAPETEKTFDQYVNDAIGFRMDPEVLLYYSDNCYGTADAICYDEKLKLLRIHDLKTGEVPAHMEQLMIYAALFCLEYNKLPGKMGFILRIYQNDGVLEHQPTVQEILPIMDAIKRNDDIIKEIKGEKVS